MTSWCLVTDIDGTLIGEREPARSLRRAVLAERKRLEDSGHVLYWVIATGRSVPGCCDVFREYGFALDDFDALVTSIGAELYMKAHSWSKRRELREEVALIEQAPDAGYHAELTRSGFSADVVRRVLEPLAFLELQSPFVQRPHKVSYFLNEDLPEHRHSVRALLESLPFPTLPVFSHGSYLDIVPPNGAKGGAVRHLMARWRLAPVRVVAAGDSGNDLSMLDQNWPGIVVGNAYPELAGLRGHRTAFFARANHAAGVLEGLRELGFLRSLG